MQVLYHSKVEKSTIEVETFYRNKNLFNFSVSQKKLEPTHTMCLETLAAIGRSMAEYIAGFNLQSRTLIRT